MLFFFFSLQIDMNQTQVCQVIMGRCIQVVGNSVPSTSSSVGVPSAKKKKKEDHCLNDYNDDQIKEAWSRRLQLLVLILKQTALFESIFSKPVTFPNHRAT